MEGEGRDRKKGERDMKGKKRKRRDRICLFLDTLDTPLLSRLKVASHIFKSSRPGAKYINKFHYHRKS